MALTIANSVRIKTYCFDTDQIGLNVLHYDITASTGSPMPEQDAIDAYTAVVAPLYAAVMHDAAVFQGATLQVLKPTVQAEYFKKLVTTGTTSPPALPRQTAGLLSWRSGIAGRRGRGRTYVAFPPGAANELDGKPTAVHLTLLRALFVQLRGPFVLTSGGNSLTLVLAIYHRSTNTFDQTITGTVASKWATQRRRGGFGRPNVLPAPIA